MRPCWGWGTQAAGLQLPQVDRVRCAACGRWQRQPLWMHDTTTLPELMYALCARCAEAKHRGCPCLAQPAKTGQQQLQLQ